MKTSGTALSPPESLVHPQTPPLATRGMYLVLLFLFLLSAIWTSFLGVLNYAPNATANYLMNTSSFDDGDFWLLSDPSPLLGRAAFTGITVNGLGYIYLVLIVIRLTTTRATGPSFNPRSALSTRLFRFANKRARRRLSLPGQRILAELRDFYFELVSHNGRYRKVWNLLFEVIEVVFQTITLHDMLLDGLHESLIIMYVFLMVINCLSCFYHITIAWKHDAYDEMVTDAVLDIVFAVIFPAVVLVQAVRSFRSDLRVMQVRQKFFPAQPYERRARIYSDPRQINLFTAAFDSLRITTPMDLAAKIGFNILTCLRWRRIALTSLGTKHRATHSPAPVKIKTREIGPLNPPSQFTKKPLEVQVPYRAVPSYVGVLFLLYGALTATYTYGALTMSNQACAPYAGTCVLYAYQWSPSGEASLCPCLVFIERDMSPSIRTWLSLPDVSQNLSLLAEAGTLRTVQVMNRGVNYALPKSLMQCSDLRHLILINTDVSELPDWMVSAFPMLEYLHIENQASGPKLSRLPSKMFSKMTSLRTLSISRQVIETIPPFDGLTNLRTMYLGELMSLNELPPLSALVRLTTLGLVQIRYLVNLPELATLSSNLHSVYIQYASLCCSGFLSDGVCNTSYPGCSIYITGTCYPEENRPGDAAEPNTGDKSANYPLISDASQRILAPFLASGAVCSADATTVLKFSPSLDSENDECQGILYRQCTTGICYNQDLGTVLCLNNSILISMREMEIKVGIACNEEEEAWLGCLSSK